MQVLVVDEAHRLKNHTSRLAVTLREEYRVDSTLLLTGTPLQNSTVSGPSPFLGGFLTQVSVCQVGTAGLVQARCRTEN